MFKKTPLNRGLVHTLCALTLAGLATAAQATLLDIRFDSRLGAGQNLFTTQGLHHTGGVGWAVSAKMTSLSLNGMDIPLSNGTVDLHGRLIDTSSSGGQVTGTFTTFNGVDADLVIADDSGTLIAGVYGKRTVKGDVGTAVGSSTSSFTVIGGSLASYFDQTGGHGTMFNHLYDITPTFSPDSFQHNFDGNIDGTVLPAPEPSPAAMLAAGLLAASLMRYRKRLAGLLPSGRPLGRTMATC